MKIAGFVKNSFVDWPTKISSVIFLGGCNFDCPHCHNKEILNALSNKISLSSVIEQIKEQIGFIDGVVISGGEPTTHPKLREIIWEIRKLGLPVKLDTNGSNFEILQKLVDDGLVDCVAMDIKAPLDKYVSLGFTKNQRDLDNIRRSIEFLETAKIQSFFRTTPIPELTDADLEVIKGLVKNRKWVKNNYVEGF